MEEGKLRKQNHAQQLTVAKTAIPKPTDGGPSKKPTEATARVIGKADCRSDDNSDQCDRELDDGGCLAI